MRYVIHKAIYMHRCIISRQRGNYLINETVVFWDVVPHSLVDIGQRFRRAYCFHHQGQYLLDYTAQHPEDSDLHTRRRYKLKSRLSNKTIKRFRDSTLFHTYNQHLMKVRMILFLCFPATL
jgi:hypothetical protein